MKKILSVLLIILILCANALVLTYKYSFFSETIYKIENYSKEKDNLVVLEKKLILPDEKTDYEILDSFDGTMTAYGSDCFGCSGITASGYDIRNNIYYEDKIFGKVRIVAADRSIPFGTIVIINGLRAYDEPLMAIVLDRGSVIRGTLMDLAFGSENDDLVKQIGRSNVKYDIIRYGW